MSGLPSLRGIRDTPPFRAIPAPETLQGSIWRNRVMRICSGKYNINKNMEYRLLTSNVNACRNFHGWNCRRRNTPSSGYVPLQQCQRISQLSCLEWDPFVYFHKSVIVAVNMMDKSSLTQGAPMSLEFKSVIFRNVLFLREYHLFDWCEKNTTNSHLIMNKPVRSIQL